jgi:hypothetical protein
VDIVTGTVRSGQGPKKKMIIKIKGIVPKKTRANDGCGDVRDSGADGVIC